MSSSTAFRIALIAGGFGLALAGCAASQTGTIGDSIPSSMGGLPTGAPERPVTPVAYPAVHDMPPPRPNTTLSAEEQVDLEKQLIAVRNKQEAVTGVPPAKKQAPAPAAAAAPAAAPLAAPRTQPATSNDSIY